MPDSNIALDMQIKAVERVLAKRHKLYPDFIEGAFEEYQAMQAVLETLKSLQTVRKQEVLFDTTAEAIDR